MDTGATYGTDTLAGGNFRWVVAGPDSTGHNVATDSLVGADALALDASNLPPGYDDAQALAAGVVNANWSTNQLTCAGTFGCHGLRDGTATYDDEFVAMSGAHHGAEGATAYRAGGTLADSYRFLDGIKGVEDPDREFSVSAADHNQYHGDARTSAEIAADVPADATTISALCGQCHGDFHSNNGGIAYGNDISNSWLRHPTDIDMNHAGIGPEYADYGGAGTNAYVPEAPVASIVTDDTVLPDVLDVAGDAIVTCISCHRAHGSPYADLMRWDYPTVNSAGGGASSAGCFQCHTTKDT